MTFGMAEESLAFYVLVITVMIAAKYDAMVGALVILLGAGIGVLGSTVNPFATGIASGFADVPLSEGLVLRLVILVVGLAVGIWFVLRYVERVRRDPAASLVYDMKEQTSATSPPQGTRVPGVALIIGVAREITVVMNNGEITDTVLHLAENALGDLGQAAFAVVMYVLFLPLSFLIPHRRAWPLWPCRSWPRWPRSPVPTGASSSRRTRAPPAC